MKHIILDTNFLLIPYQFKVDIFSELNRIMQESYELVVLQSTLKELKKLASSEKGKNKLAARLALALIDHSSPKIIKTKESYADKDIIENAQPPHYLVATQDRELRSKLFEKNVPVIILRQKTHLQILSP